MPGERDSRVMLDVCVDRALRGEEWRTVLRPGDPDEVRKLMEVAEMLLAMARRNPPIEPPAKRRLWDRLFNRFSEARLIGVLLGPRGTRGAIPGVGEC